MGSGKGRNKRTQLKLINAQAINEKKISIKQHLLVKKALSHKSKHNKVHDEAMLSIWRMIMGGNPRGDSIPDYKRIHYIGLMINDAEYILLHHGNKLRKKIKEEMINELCTSCKKEGLDSFNNKGEIGEEDIDKFNKLAMITNAFTVFRYTITEYSGSLPDRAEQEVLARLDGQATVIERHMDAMRKRKGY